MEDNKIDSGNDKKLQDLSSNSRKLEFHNPTSNNSNTKENENGSPDCKKKKTGMPSSKCHENIATPGPSSSRTSAPAYKSAEKTNLKRSVIEEQYEPTVKRMTTYFRRPQHIPTNLLLPKPIENYFASVETSSTNPKPTTDRTDTLQESNNVMMFSSDMAESTSSAVTQSSYEMVSDFPTDSELDSFEMVTYSDYMQKQKPNIENEDLYTIFERQHNQLMEALRQEDREESERAISGERVLSDITNNPAMFDSLETSESFVMVTSSDLEELPTTSAKKIKQ